MNEQLQAQRRSDRLDLGRSSAAIQVPAKGRFVGPVRCLAVALAAQCGLTVDEIDDLQMAVDEACSLLLTHTKDPQSWLRVDFHLSDGEVLAEVSVAPVDGSPAQVNRFGLQWTVLSALADELDVGASGQLLTIRLTKRRRLDQR